jgi:hypothetical protein
MTTIYAVAVGVADVRRDPNSTSELVTQALMNRPANPGETNGDWTHVELSDYAGWIQNDDLADPPIKGFTRIGEYCATPLELVVVVNETYTPLFVSLDGDDAQDTLYLSTVLPLLDTVSVERVKVALPGEQTGWLSRDAVSIRQGEDCYPRRPVGVVTSYAHAFVGVPYLWGGTSWKGIDCSGLVQLCYRMGGYLLPRDANQQHDALAHTVSREEMQEGDLIFFGSERITHVGMALNNKEYIHAAGQPYHRVTISSFDLEDARYDQHLAGIVRGIKRVID